MRLILIIFILIPINCYSQVIFKTEKDLIFGIINLINKEYLNVEPNAKRNDICCIIFDNYIKKEYFSDSIPFSNAEIIFGDQTLTPIGKYYIKVKYPVIGSKNEGLLALDFYIRENEFSFSYSDSYYYLIKHDSINDYFTLTFKPPYTIPTSPLPPSLQKPNLKTLQSAPFASKSSKT